MFYCELGILLLPWAVFLGLAIVFAKLVTWAKKRKSGAIALGVVIQMFLPDPQVQKTISHVVEAKQEVKKQRSGNSSPDDPEDIKPEH